MFLDGAHKLDGLTGCSTNKHSAAHICGSLIVCGRRSHKWNLSFYFALWTISTNTPKSMREWSAFFEIATLVAIEGDAKITPRIFLSLSEHEINTFCVCGFSPSSDHWLNDRWYMITQMPIFLIIKYLRCDYISIVVILGFFFNLDT